MTFKGKTANVALAWSSLKTTDGNVRTLLNWQLEFALGVYRVKGAQLDVLCSLQFLRKGVSYRTNQRSVERQIKLPNPRLKGILSLFRVCVRRCFVWLKGNMDRRLRPLSSILKENNPRASGLLTGLTGTE